MTFSMDDIKEIFIKDNIQWSGHILTRMQQRGIKIKDIINCILNGEIIEQYEEDYPYPSCLILGKATDEKSIHVVCALEGNNIWMITAYYPSESEWLDDLKSRRR
jgi:hypothetical protein